MHTVAEISYHAFTTQARQLLYTVVDIVVISLLPIPITGSITTTIKSSQPNYRVCR